MKKKITLNELRNIINQRVMKLVENHLNDIKSLEDRLYYFMGADGEIDHNDLLDVASETGLNPDDETFIVALAGARARKKQEKNDELKSDIQYVIASEFGGDAPASFNDFYAVFNGQHFDQDYDKLDVFQLYNSMTKDPNQLALFEALKKKLKKTNKSKTPEGKFIMSKEPCVVCGSKRQYVGPETGGWKSCADCGTI